MGMLGALTSLGAANPEEDSELAISHTPLIGLQTLVNTSNEREEVAAQKVLKPSGVWVQGANWGFKQVRLWMNNPLSKSLGCREGLAALSTHDSRGTAKEVWEMSCNCSCSQSIPVLRQSLLHLSCILPPSSAGLIPLQIEVQPGCSYNIFPKSLCSSSKPSRGRREQSRHFLAASTN